MGLRNPQPGDYVGHALYNRYGNWLVTVSRFRGRHPERGYEWDNLPMSNFFRLDVLARQLAAAGIRMERVMFEHDRCVLVPASDQRGLVAVGGIRIKRFMARNYGTIGPERKPIRWDWEIGQYD